MPTTNQTHKRLEDAFKAARAAGRWVDPVLTRPPSQPVGIQWWKEWGELTR